MSKNNIGRLSFELFPPQTLAAMDKLRITIEELDQFSPDYYSVTFGAGGSNRDKTLNLVRYLVDARKTVVPHIAGVGMSKIEVSYLLEQYQLLGINRLVVLRGDIANPSDKSECDFQFATDLIQYIQEFKRGDFAINVAAYPECHPESESIEADIANLKRKVSLGAEAAITQYFFDLTDYAQLVKKMIDDNVTIPVFPGIMPIYSYDKLKRFSDRCGATIPPWLNHSLHLFKDNKVALRTYGVEVIASLCRDLLNAGAPGLHFYTLNQHESVIEILKRLGSVYNSQDYALGN